VGSFWQNCTETAAALGQIGASIEIITVFWLRFVKTGGEAKIPSGHPIGTPHRGRIMLPARVRPLLTPEASMRHQNN
jgi:hypothetical protein